MRSIEVRRCWLLASCLGLAYMVGTVQAQACDLPVGGDNMVLSPENLLQSTFEDGSTVTFQCDTGYERTEGFPRITCTNGEWSALTMKCQRKNCGNPGNILNGQYNIDGGTFFGDVAVATCNPGHDLIGDDRRQCMDGGWSNRIPVCERSKCGRAPAITNGRPTSNDETYEYDSVVTYKCDSGFELSGSKKIVCKGNDKFEPPAPECIKVECPQPTVLNANVIEGISPPHGYNSFLTYKCKGDFVLHGSATITCGIDSVWNPPPPECRAPPTTTKSTPTTTTPTTTKKPTDKAPAPGPDPKPTAQPNPSSNVGAIVGGIIGSLALVAVGIGLFVGCKKKGSTPDYCHDDNVTFDSSSPAGYSGNVAIK